MNERRQILEMLAEGKISAEDAERLLAKLASSGEASSLPSASERPSGESKGNLPKYLRVLVNSNDGDSVNLRVPFALVRTGIKLTNMMPEQASRALSEQGIDLAKLSEMEADELVQALQELTMDVESGDGDTVRVFCE
jgi:hypothetical protein